MELFHESVLFLCGVGGERNKWDAAGLRCGVCGREDGFATRFEAGVEGEGWVAGICGRGIRRASGEIDAGMERDGERVDGRFSGWNANKRKQASKCPVEIKISEPKTNSS